MDACPFCGETEKLHFVLLQVHCGICGAAGPVADSEAQAIANWNRRPTSTLTINGRPVAEITAAINSAPSAGTGVALPSTGHHLMFEPLAFEGIPSMPFIADDLAAARERRELASLPSVETAAEPDGLSMDFDLGGDKPRKR